MNFNIAEKKLTIYLANFRFEKRDCVNIEQSVKTLDPTNIATWLPNWEEALKYEKNHEQMKCDTKALSSVLSSVSGKCVHRKSRDKELQYSRVVNDMASFLGRP